MHLADEKKICLNEGEKYFGSGTEKLNDGLLKNDANNAVIFF